MARYAVDHLVVLCPDLAEASQALALATGVEAAYGGKHGSGWTENAVAALGDHQYLELLAATPEAPEGADPWVDRVRKLKAPSLHAWCASAELGLHNAAQALDGVGVSYEGPSPWERARPDGVTLKWSLLEPKPNALDPALPFFIDWLDSPHPSKDAPPGLSIDCILIVHPEADRLNWLKVDDLRYSTAPELRFEAELSGPAGGITYEHIRERL